MKKLENKVVVITGGTSGMGLATAKLAKENGAIVISTVKSVERLNEIQDDIDEYFDKLIVADVSNVKDIEHFYDEIHTEYGKIDVLFLNAGTALFAPLEYVDESMIDTLLNVNFKGVFFGIQKALPFLNSNASIILNSSIAHKSGTPNTSIYTATKAAVSSLTRTIGSEITFRNIRINTISPGPIETPIFEKMGMDASQVAEIKEYARSSVPMGRMGKGTEIANTVLFLASNDSSFITGAEIEVDGGSSNF